MKKGLLGISLLTISCLYFLLAVVIILVTLITETPVIYGIIISIIVLILEFVVSPYLTDLSMKFFYKATFNYELPEYIKSFITEVCTKHNMKYPRIGYIDDGAPNAFTYGHTKNDARVILTRGIFELLDEEEVKAVVAHELGHASHYDMIFMTVAQLVPLVLYGIYEMFRERDNSNSDKNSNKVLISFIAYVLYVISNYIVLGLSRTREYYADSFSIEETKNPNALASALVNIGYGLSTAKTKTAHSAAKSNALGIFDSKTSKSLVITSMDNGKISKDYIKNAMKWEQWNIWAKWYELHSTHPLISKRLIAISKRSQEFNQEPYINFDLKKEESYMDDFLLEVIINFLPAFALIAALIIGSISIYEEKNIVLAMGISVIIFALALFARFKRRYPFGNYLPRKVRDLLGEVKVSNITAIACELEGKIIGRGNPGCIFNEDFVLQDDTGIIFMDYNQPINLVNKIFALFKSKDYFDKVVKVKGWYRRSPVPYVEIKTIEIDGKTKKVYTFGLTITLYILLLLIGLGLVAISILA